MPTRYDTVSFLSDYGTDDEFAGVVRSVIRQLAPHVAVVDLTHGIPAFDVRAGGLALARASQYVAPGIVLAVVDPGVGTHRRAVAIEVAGGDGVFVGPDNGLLASAVAMVGGAERAVELTNAEYQLVAPGATFAGRDVFAPAAAHLANGVPFDELGDAVDTSSLLPGVLPVMERRGDDVSAEVLWVDRFGNAQLNLSPDDLVGFGDLVALRVADRTRRARVVSTYGHITPGEVGLVVDSYGLLAICLDRQSAADELGLDVASQVVLSPAEDRGQVSSVTIGRKP